MTPRGFTRPSAGSLELHRTIQILDCTEGCLVPLGVQGHRSRQLRTIINIFTQGVGHGIERKRGEVLLEIISG